MTHKILCKLTQHYSHFSVLGETEGGEGSLKGVCATQKVHNEQENKIIEI